jgi:uncharacterized membrane protein
MLAAGLALIIAWPLGKWLAKRTGWNVRLSWLLSAVVLWLLATFILIELGM